jgi:hypothetical protein
MQNEPVSIDFDHYKIYYITSVTKPFPAVISCYNNGVEVGVLRFRTMGQRLEAPSFAGNKVTLDYPIERFGDIHTILLHEKPLSLYITAERHWGGVTTSQLEATGEMENGTEFFTRISDGVVRALKEMDSIHNSQNANTPESSEISTELK